MTYKYFIKNIQNIKYLDYEIDKNHNLKLFNEVKFFIKNAQKYNLDIILAGACGNVFHFSKLFRTIKDIDLYVEKKEIETWLNIVHTRYEYLYPEEFKPLDFLKNQLKQEQPIPFRNKKNPKLKVDFIFKNFDLIQDQIFIKKFKEFNIKYSYLYKLHYKNRYNRQKDIDDINFYLPFIKI